MDTSQSNAPFSQVSSGRISRKELLEKLHEIEEFMKDSNVEKSSVSFHELRQAQAQLLSLLSGYDDEMEKSARYAFG